MAKPINTSKVSGGDKIRNICDKGTRAIYAWLCCMFRIQVNDYISILAHKAFALLPRLFSQLLRSLQTRS